MYSTPVSTERGVVVFEVPHEFRLSLSVVGDDQQLPWRLVNLEVLVGAGFPGSPPLCHSQQTRYLTQVTQSHLVAATCPLSHVFSVLHTFCLSLLLDCLHTQASQMVSVMCGGHVRVEEYLPGGQLRVGYWYPLSPHSTIAGVSGTRLLVTVDPTSPSHPITTSHSPPLPGAHSAKIEVGRVCLEEVIW
jgi:mediator of RNA polymerase II transcription subunit 14